MLRFALLIVLPLVALAQMTPQEQREYALRYLESIKPCILQNVGCPPGGGLDISNFGPLVKLYHQLRTPEECKCDTSVESCKRQCYYALVMQQHMISAEGGKTNAAEIAEAKAQMRAMVEMYYKPCIIENRNCEIMGGLDFERIAREIAEAAKVGAVLPQAECSCDFDTESCVRQCYFGYLKKQTLAALPGKKRLA